MSVPLAGRDPYVQERWLLGPLRKHQKRLAKVPIVYKK
jgi:hypothetical protein